MDFLSFVDWPDALVAAAVAYGALRLEFAYRRMWWARHMARSHPVRSTEKPPLSVTGEIRGAVEAVVCAGCGTKTRDYVMYDDGSYRDFICHAEGR